MAHSASLVFDKPLFNVSVLVFSWYCLKVAIILQFIIFMATYRGLCDSWDFPRVIAESGTVPIRQTSSTKTHPTTEFLKLSSRCCR